MKHVGLNCVQTSSAVYRFVYIYLYIKELIIKAESHRPPGLEFAKSQRAEENRGKLRKLIAKSSVVLPTTLAVKG